MWSGSLSTTSGWDIPASRTSCGQGDPGAGMPVGAFPISGALSDQHQAGCLIPQVLEVTGCDCGGTPSYSSVYNDHLQG